MNCTHSGAPVAFLRSMPELIRQQSTHVRTPDGHIYLARTYGDPQADGRWTGWIEFHPIGRPDAPVLRTGRETTQSNREALEYWAAGLEGVYFEGAFERARLAQPFGGTGGDSEAALRSISSVLPKS